MNDFFSTYCKGIEFYRNQILIFFQKVISRESSQIFPGKFPAKMLSFGKTGFPGKTVFPGNPVPEKITGKFPVPVPGHHPYWPLENRIYR